MCITRGANGIAERWSTNLVAACAYAKTVKVLWGLTAMSVFCKNYLLKKPKSKRSVSII
jgi:hypothetical protein